MLTGKCKEDFQTWYWNRYKSDVGILHNFQFFNRMYFEMQYGVYVDFFDGVGIIIEIENFGSEYWCFSIYTNDESFEPIPLKKVERTKARQKAIEKANEIYNENK